MNEKNVRLMICFIQIVATEKNIVTKDGITIIIIFEAIFYHSASTEQRLRSLWPQRQAFPIFNVHAFCF